MGRRTQYVAFASTADKVARLRERALTRLQKREHWDVAFYEAGLAVLVCPREAGFDRLYHLDRRLGVVLGRLFDRDYEGNTAPRQISLDSECSSRIAETDGQYLLENFWGDYIAFLRTGSGERYTVLRDPSGAHQCFVSETDGVQVYFSRLTDFETLLSGPMPVDWSYVRSRMAYGAVPRHRTGIAGVSQVMPGECLTVASGTARRALCWNPLPFVRERRLSDRATAGRLVHSTVRSCIHAWASCHPNILLLLSGGLDSAIVLSCLKDAPGSPKVTAINYFSPGADSDERRYARLAAEHAGVELVQLARDPTVSWAGLLNLRRTPEPYAAIGTLQTQKQISALAEETGATVQFSGHGGDLLFYRHWAFLAATSRPTLQHLLSAAYLDRSSIWKVLGQSIYNGLFRARFEILPKPTVGRALLGPAILEHLRETQLPPNRFTEALQTAPAGKQYQAACLYHAQCALEDPLNVADAGAIPERAPLLSQPLTEAALSIPLHLLIYEGRDRALARDVFSGQIPDAIERRQSKGGLEEYAKESLLNNLSLVKELLLDGELAKRGLLDREKLLEVLAREPSEIPARLAELYDYVNVEAWLHSVS